MGLWEDYKLDREGLTTINMEHGFVSYKIINNTCLVSDIYTDKEHRKGFTFLKLAKKMEQIAKENKCNLMEAHVWCKTNDPSLSLKAILSYDFKVIGAENDIIFLVKEI